MDGSPRRKRGRPKKQGKSAIAVTTPKTLKDPNPILLSKTEKKKFLQQRVLTLQALDYDQIIERFGPVLEMVTNGGTMQQCAYAGGMCVEELEILLDYGRFGGSNHWHDFYEEFFRAASSYQIEVMRDLQACAKMGEKWAIQRLMNIMSPGEFGSFDCESPLPATPANTGITQHFHSKTDWTPEDVQDAEYTDETN